MQKNIRINENQLLYLVSKAKRENSMASYLYKRSSDTGKWQQRYFVLYQNLLFYFENDTASRPSGVALLEGSYCERLITPLKGKESEKQYVFTITYKSEGQRNYDLRTETESECNAWIDAIRRASYSKVVEQKEELEQKHLHIIQILESERQAKWHYVQQTEELVAEVKKLKAELQKFKKDRTSNHHMEEETDEIKKIKKEVTDEQAVVLKVQSFFRGWLCRRRWKQIVDLYIRSPHAESMRKRNSIVFSMVECEEEYNQQLSALVTCFLRPLRMAASSKKPPITHEDVNSIFLNSETLLFLHQIFFKGLCARLENWPTLVLGDLFDMLLPMLCIYQEYVRNHHYSLQVLAEYKQRPEFNNLLKRYEEKPACENRTLETFLTYPMHQIPRYIITLHELLAHTPHDHVERSSLEYAKTKLEELSRIMHDEVSETENIRKNLSIERMIIEGCDILLDVNQTFVRQGPLLQVFTERSKAGRGRLPSLGPYAFRDTKKEEVRQVFLFTNHMLLTTRAKENGRLHLAKQNGKLSLIDCTLIEDPSSEIYFDEENTSFESATSGFGSSSQGTLLPYQAERDRLDYNGLDLRIIVDSKSGPQLTIILVASTHIEKAAWCSDISQCIENLHYSDLLNSSMSESSSVTMPQSVRSDPKLFRDDVDIKFSRTLNSCKVPQIRHGSVDRLLDRLTDLRFLSIDFLNTFLLTYRVFTTGERVLEALKKVYRSPDGASGESDAVMMGQSEQSGSEAEPHEFTKEPPCVDRKTVIKPTVIEKVEQLRQIRHLLNKHDVSSSEEDAEQQQQQRSLSVSFGKHVDFAKAPLDRGESLDSDEGRQELASFLAPTKQAPIATCETLCDPDYPDIPAIKMDSSLSDVVLLSDEFGESFVDDINIDSNGKLLPPGSVLGGSTSPEMMLCGSPTFQRSEASSDTLTLTPTTPHASPVTSPLGSPRRSLPQPLSPRSGETSPRRPSTPIKMPEKYSEAFSLSPLSSPVRIVKPTKVSSPVKIPSPILRSTSPHRGNRSPSASPKLRRAPSPISYSYSTPNIMAPQIKIRPYSTEAESVTSTPRSSFATHVEGSPPPAKVGTVVTSSRQSKRRSSSSAATAAFAVATAGSGYAGEQSARVQRFLSAGAGATDTRLLKKRESVISTAATMRVLNIIKHWVSKHSQDFECDPQLKVSVIDFLEEMVCNTNLLPAEHKTAASILRTISKEASEPAKPDLTKLLQPPEQSSKDTFDSLSALDIAEQLTFLDHQIFTSIRSEELLGQAWMKPEKASRAPHVLLVSKRFNECSRLVVSEIVRRQNLPDRVACIEKWAAIADICRCMHNYNGVLQICAAFVNSSVYRLKKTWEKLSKQTKQMIERLQTLVSSDGRFKNMRDALHRCDPPCIPYLGMYLTDLSFIEEGTPDLTEDRLVNFSKMRMIAHVIREIRLFQQTSYRIEHHPRVTNYLLDPRNLLDDEQTYKASLEIEPKLSRLSVVSTGPS